MVGATGTVDLVVRAAFRLRWLPRHVLALVLVIALGILGRWQWDVSQSSRGGLQNLLYAFQWWFMAAMVIYGWARLLHDAAHPRAATDAADDASPVRADTLSTVGLLGDDESRSRPASTSDLIDAQLATANTGARAEETDEELVEYNQYLAFLNQRAERAR